MKHFGFLLGRTHFAGLDMLGPVGDCNVGTCKKPYVIMSLFDSSSSVRCQISLQS